MSLNEDKMSCHAGGCGYHWGDCLDPGLRRDDEKFNAAHSPCHSDDP